MSLATRCPHCGTTFRLVRDQLLLSNGWVRCGRCNEAFNAGERQFAYELPATQPAVGRGSADDAVSTGASQNTHHAAGPARDIRSVGGDDTLANRVFAPTSATHRGPAPFDLPGERALTAPTIRRDETFESRPVAAADTTDLPEPSPHLSSASVSRDDPPAVLASRSSESEDLTPPASTPLLEGDERDWLLAAIAGEAGDVAAFPNDQAMPIGGALGAQPADFAAIGAGQSFGAAGRGGVDGLDRAADALRLGDLSGLLADAPSAFQKLDPVADPERTPVSAVPPTAGGSHENSTAHGEVTAHLAGHGNQALGWGAPDGSNFSLTADHLDLPLSEGADFDSPLDLAAVLRYEFTAENDIEGAPRLDPKPVPDVAPEPPEPVFAKGAWDSGSAPALTSAGSIADIPFGEPTPEPQFLRQARKRERWQHPLVRLLLWLSAILLLALGAAQAGWTWRDSIATQWPQLRPMLQQLCAAAGCQVAAPRRPQALVIDTSSMSPDADGVLALHASLRNRSADPVAYPALELTLTDAQDQIVARKILEPADYLGRNGHDPGALQHRILEGLPGQAELPIRLELRLSHGHASGYTLYAFYP